VTTVRLEGVSKSFGDLVACTDIDLTIRDGEFFVLLGPSGCGKSTTLRMIAGLETVSDGDIYFNDEAVTGTEPAERDVAMVFQNYALYPHKTVHQNIAFPLELMRRNIDDEEIERRVQETAELLQITDQLDKKPKNLSGGQQQRVALGRSIIREPSVFLMDEPLSNLDAKLRIRMRSELKQLHERLGVTTVYVTHDQEEAMSLADRIGLLNDGRVQQVGPPREVFERPANTWVAGFIGNPPMNLLPCSLDEDERAVSNDAFEFPVDEEAVAEIRERDTAHRLSFGVRPMDLTMVEEASPTTITSSVLTVEPTGERTLVTATIGDTEITVETDRDVGDEIKDTTVELRPEKCYLYDDRDELLYVSETPKDPAYAGGD
jgi:multiple sugar transport system ATP-binding protein